MTRGDLRSKAGKGDDGTGKGYEGEIEEYLGTDDKEGLRKIEYNGETLPGHFLWRRLVTSRPDPVHCEKKARR